MWAIGREIHLRGTHVALNSDQSHFISYYSMICDKGQYLLGRGLKDILVPKSEMGDVNSLATKTRMRPF